MRTIEEKNNHICTQYNIIQKTLLIVMVVLMFTVNTVNIKAESVITNSFRINGNDITCNSVEDPGDYKCWDYAKNLYNKIWGPNYSFSGSNRTSSDNMLKNLSAEECALTTENIKKFVSQAIPGANIRLCQTKEDFNSNDNNLGHNLILADYDDTYITVFTNGYKISPANGRATVKFTYSDFVYFYTDKHNLNEKYIKYIKYPNAAPYNPNQNASNEFYIDLNSAIKDSFTGKETFNYNTDSSVFSCDVYIAKYPSTNYSLVAQNVCDFYEKYPIRSKYKITNIKVGEGYIYEGSSEITGVIGYGDIDITLSFTKTVSMGDSSLCFPLGVNDPSKVIGYVYGGLPEKYVNGKEDETQGHYGTSYRAIDMSGGGASYSRTPIYVDQDGEIVSYYRNNGQLTIKHTMPLVLKDGKHIYGTWYSTYCHCLHLRVKDKNGNIVEIDNLPEYKKVYKNGTEYHVCKGELIGYFGNVGAGNVSNSHLHYEISLEVSDNSPSNNKYYNDKTIALPWLGGHFEKIQYKPYGDDIADQSAYKRNMLDISYAPASTHNHEYGSVNKSGESPHVCKDCGYFSVKEDVKFDTKKYRVVIENLHLDNNPYNTGDVLKDFILRKNETVNVVGYVINNDNDKWYKVSYDNNVYYVYENHLEEGNSLPDSKLTFSDFTIQNSTMKEGDSNKLFGNIYSNYNYSVTAVLDNSITLYSRKLNANTSINLGVALDVDFQNLSVGNHMLRVSTYDSFNTNNVIEKVINFTVQAEVERPCVSTIEDIESGKVLYLTYTAGADVYYTTDETEPSQTSNKYLNGINIVGSSKTVKAIAYKNGKKSSILTYTVYLKRADAPSIEYGYYPDGTHVSISCNENSIIYYQEDGLYKLYLKPIVVTEPKTISAYAKEYGHVNSNIVSQNIDVMSAYNPEILTLNYNISVPLGDIELLSWRSVENASSYDVNVYKNKVLIDSYTNIKTNSISYSFDEVGEYQFEVRAVNDIGNSDYQKSGVIKSIAPSTVKFLNDDDSVISIQEVKYGEDAIVPTDPSKKGYTFTGWDKECTNVKEDLVVKAIYKINTYIVTITDSNGNRIGDKQSIKYNQPVDFDNIYLNIPEGYKLLDWEIEAEANDSSLDYNHVDSNMTLKPIFAWENENLPIICSIKEANRNDVNLDSNYEVVVNCINYNEAFTTALLRVSLKSSEDKLLLTESRTIALPRGTLNDEGTDFTFTLNYKDGNNVAYKAEAIVLGYENDTTNTSLSEKAEKNIAVISEYTFGEWSDWSEEKENNHDDYETKVQYRYRKKNTTTSTESSLEGWISDGYEVLYTPWTAVGYSKNTIENDLVKVDRNDYKTITDKAAYTEYTYYHSYAYIDGLCWMSYSATYYANYEEVVSTTPYKAGNVYDGRQSYYKEGGSGRNLWWLKQTRQVPAVTHDEYKNYTRTAYNNYKFYKWDDWSDWQDEVVNLNDNLEVETREVYRHRDCNVPVESIIENSENTSGEFIVVSNETYNKLPNIEIVNLKDRLATVMVYKGKNSDPNSSQLEYVGQTVIGENNSYSLTIKTKENPSITTGDFVICLAIEGTNGLFNVGLIKAPREKYTINYLDGFGNLISSQEVYEGDDAIVPNNPQHNGYTFYGWNGTATCINRDMNINAIEVANSYAVAFVDWENGNVIPTIYTTGEKVIDKLPEDPSTEGCEFVGWGIIDKETGNMHVVDNQIVDSNLVVQAIYNKSTYTVNFYDANDNNKKLISSQKVNYGESAILPEVPELMNKIFLGWETAEEWWNVKKDMDIHPIAIYQESTPEPLYEVNGINEEMKKIVKLKAVDDATIYYSIDGNDPVIGFNAFAYSEPIEVDDTTIIKALAVSSNKNNSDHITIELMPDIYVEDTSSDTQEIIAYYPIVNKLDEIDLSINIKNNQGIYSYTFFVECDNSTYYLDYDEENDSYSIESGDISSKGNLYVNKYEGGYKITWFSDEICEDDGTLFKLKLKSFDVTMNKNGEIVELGDDALIVSPILIKYSLSDTVGSDLEEADIEISTSAKTSHETEGLHTQNKILGDINSDGKITTVDVIKIAKFVVGTELFNNKQVINADVTCDGIISNADVIRLLKYIVGSASLR